MLSLIFTITNFNLWIIYRWLVIRATFDCSRDLLVNFIRKEFGLKLLIYGWNLGLISFWIDGIYSDNCSNNGNEVFSWRNVGHLSSWLALFWGEIKMNQHNRTSFQIDYSLNKNIKLKLDCFDSKSALLHVMLTIFVI